ncbi:hypothetical protein Ae201684_018918 [Aphanomyces euteiches]|uniref:Uncharacterized protein n=1 Tax=Aphanomyces euteiches TaxID=100861 RepID=A0A6G0W439_9STRA|nr:hypothetical protein Ae201684_018918 [Aphanomyces euteiches]
MDRPACAMHRMISTNAKQRNLQARQLCAVAKERFYPFALHLCCLKFGSGMGDCLDRHLPTLRLVMLAHLCQAMAHAVVSCTRVDLRNVKCALGQESAFLVAKLFFFGCNRGQGSKHHAWVDETLQWPSGTECKEATPAILSFEGHVYTLRLFSFILSGETGINGCAVSSSICTNCQYLLPW